MCIRDSISHVPHFVASSLVELAVRHAGDQEALFRLAAGGFKDSTRIAAGSPALWTGIAFENPEAITRGLEEMQEILSQYAKALAGANRAEFTALLDRAANARKALPAKWIPATEDLLEVRIPVSYTHLDVYKRQKLWRACDEVVFRTAPA